MRKKHSTNKLLIGMSGALSLVVLSLPFTFASAKTSESTVKADIGSAISISSTDPSTINITPTPSGDENSEDGTVTVSTNNSTGYTLTIKSKTATTDMVDGAKTLPASSNTYASPNNLAVNTWGYRVDSYANWGTGGSDYAGITTSEEEIGKSTTPKSSDKTTVTYAINADSSQPSGTYKGEVVYTATTNP